MAPNSAPRSRRSAPWGPVISVGNGPLPTRVQYALVTPQTESIAVGGIPVPVQAPPAVQFELVA